MKVGHTTPGSIDEYIAAFSPEVRSILERIRVTIMKAAPDAEEKIIYQLPTFTLKGAEPWFLAFNASIEIHPVMIPDNLAKAGGAIENAVKKYA